MKRIALLALLTCLVGCDGKFSSSDMPAETPENPELEIPEDDKELEGKIPDVDACKDVAVDPGPFNARRMTDWEIIRTVNQSFGVDISAEAAEELPKDERVSGFSNTGSGLVTNIDHINAYEALSQVIVAKLGDWPTFVGNHTSCVDDTNACRVEFIENAGFKAFRRPLVSGESDLFLPLFEVALTEGDDFNVGAELVVRAMLQSPQFLFRLEAQDTDSGDLKQLAGFEVASRLSYLIWATSPDDALYAAAAADALGTDAEIAAQVTRMLADPKAREAATRYIRDWLAIDNIDGLVRGELYPEFTPAVVAGMKEETLAYFDKQIWEDDVPVAQLFTAQHTYANRDLAEFYGFDNPQDGLQRYDLTGHPERIGFLTHAGILALAGKADDPSLVERGLFVMNNLFCDSVVNTLDVTPEMPELEPGRSQRFYSELRLSNPGCGNCHIQFDPLGAAFERFDGVGKYVTNDIHGNDLLEEGTFLDKSTDEMVNFSSVADFIQKASESELARDCMIKKPVQFAIGRSLIGSDACMLSGIKAKFDPTTSTYKDLIREIALSPYFRSVRSTSNDSVN